MSKFSRLVGDAVRYHETTHDALRAAVRLTGDDWSPEARAAALASRKAHAESHNVHESSYDDTSSNSGRQQAHKKAASAHAAAGAAHNASGNTQVAGMHMFAQRAHERGASSNNVNIHQSSAELGVKRSGDAMKKAGYSS
jgi:hypothetical protein